MHSFSFRSQNSCKMHLNIHVNVIHSNHWTHPWKLLKVYDLMYVVLKGRGVKFICNKNESNRFPDDAFSTDTPVYHICWHTHITKSTYIDLPNNPPNEHKNLSIKNKYIYSRGICSCQYFCPAAASSAPLALPRPLIT